MPPFHFSYHLFSFRMLPVMLCLLSALSAGGWAQQAPQRAFVPEEDTAPEPATTAIPWANPLADGRLRILLITPAGAAGDAQQVALRLDADIAHLQTWSAEAFGQESKDAFAPDALSDRLRKLLGGKLDAILLGRVDISAWPEPLRHALFDRVFAGAGLVLTHVPVTPDSDLDRFLSTFDPVDAEPELRRGIPPFVNHALHQVLPGELEGRRIVQIEYAGDAPRMHAFLPMPEAPVELDPAFTDDASSLLCRAILWASGRVPGTRIAGLADAAPQGPSEEEIPPDLTPEFVEAMQQSATAQPVRPFRVTLAAPAHEQLELRVQLRRPGLAFPFHETTVTVPKGAAEANIDLLIGPGKYTADAWLTSRKGVVDWFSQALEIEGWPTFSELKYDKNFLMPNDTIALSMDVPPVFSQHRFGCIYAQATDSYGRLVAQSSVGFEHEGGHIQLRLNLADLVAPMLKVEILAAEGEPRTLSQWEQNVSDRAYLYFPVRQLQQLREPRLLVANPAPREPAAHAQLLAMAELGASALYAEGAEHSLIEASFARLHLLPELARYTAEATGEGTVRTPCLSNGEYIRAESMAIQKSALLHWAGSTGSYSLGNGNYLLATDEPVCQCPHCLRPFQQLMRAEYGSLDTLNRVWQSDFNDWSHLFPLGRTDARELQVLPPAVDFWEYMDGVFAAFHGQMAEAVHTADGTGAAGFRALSEDAPNHAYDWAELARQVDFIAANPEPVVAEKLGSYLKPAAYSGLAFGDLDALPSPPHVRALPWRAVMNGLPALWHMAPFSTVSAPARVPALNPAGEASEMFAPMLASLNVLDAGLGVAMLAGVRQHQGIAIYESRASRRLNALDVQAPASSTDAEAGFLALFQSLGFAPRFVDEQRLLHDGLRDYRVLVLPMTRAMSDAEVNAVESFVEGGGALIADVLPATFDRHAYPREASPLAHLFQAQAATPEAGPVSDAPLPLRPSDPAAAGRPTTAIAPAVFEGTHRSLLFNAPLAGTAVAAARGIAADFLGGAGIAPPADFMPRKGESWQGEVSEMHLGEARIIAVLAAPQASGKQQEATLSFDKGAHVYNPLDGTRELRPQKIGLALKPGDAAAFTQLPYEVGDVDLVAQDEIVQGQRLNVTTRVTTAGGDVAPGEHIIRVELLSPWRKSLRHYRQTLKGVGTFQTYIPLALNEPGGLYTLVARDALTGIETTRTIKVLPLTQ